LSGYLRLGQSLLANERVAEAWNFGPRSDGELTVEALASRLHAHWPALTIEPDLQAHPHEAALLRLNCAKAEQRLRWHPVWDVDTAVARTADWYRRFHDSRITNTAADLGAYVAAARAQGLEWAS
jgi:CDP-glucose 4,6-dehydratase